MYSRTSLKRKYVFFAILVTKGKFNKIEASESKFSAEVGSCRQQIFARGNIFLVWRILKGGSRKFLVHFARIIVFGRI